MNPQRSSIVKALAWQIQTPSIWIILSVLSDLLIVVRILEVCSSKHVRDEEIQTKQRKLTSPRWPLPQVV